MADLPPPPAFVPTSPSLAPRFLLVSSRRETTSGKKGMLILKYLYLVRLYKYEPKWGRVWKSPSFSRKEHRKEKLRE